LYKAKFSSYTSTTYHDRLKTKDENLARHLWFIPVILATEEAEIRRMAVGSQP
jgi:hypothetical protein